MPWLSNLSWYLNASGEGAPPWTARRAAAATGAKFLLLVGWLAAGMLLVLFTRRAVFIVALVAAFAYALFLVVLGRLARQNPRWAGGRPPGFTVLVGSLAVIMAAVAAGIAVPEVVIAVDGHPRTVVVTEIIYRSGGRYTPRGYDYDLETPCGSAVPGQLHTSAPLTGVFRRSRLDIVEGPHGLVSPQLPQDVPGNAVPWTVTAGIALAVLAWVLAFVGLRRREPS